MTLLTANALPYLAQLTAILLAGMALAIPLRRADPRLRLYHWQATLALALLGPLCGRWQPAPDALLTIVTGPARLASPPTTPDAAPIPYTTLLLVVYCIGLAVLLARLTIGAIRIRRHRAAALPFPGFHWAAECRLSPALTSPVATGLLRPLILLPSFAPNLPPAQLHAIVLHESIHIWRRDIHIAVIEELLRALLWFHPGVWFVLARIHAAREHVVDREVLLQSTDTSAYLDALLAVAARKPQADLLPAPLFIARSQLAARVADIVEGVPTMKTRTLAARLTLGALAALAAGLVTSTFLPLTSWAQESRSDQVPGTVRNGPAVLHAVQAVYPPAARLKGIEGTVEIEASIDAGGLVTDARVLSGPEELRRAAIQAALEWQFASGAAPTRATIEMSFALPATRRAAGPLKRIDFVRVPAELQARVLPRLGVKEGDPLPAGAQQDLLRAVREVSPNLLVALTSDNVLEISLAPASVRVGGNVMSTKLRSKTAPKYPLEAKAARIQGTVRFEAYIGKDGRITNLIVVAGHPILVTAAQEAVKTWEYEPTLLNGNPVEVLTMIDVNFTLAP